MKKIQTKNKNYRRLIIFTRFPVAGKSKTRLIPYLGSEKASLLQREMTEHIMRIVRQFSLISLSEIEVHFDNGELDDMRNWLGLYFNYRKQSSGTLGERILHSFSSAFSDGVQYAVIIGTDSTSSGVTRILIRSTSVLSPILITAA